MLLSDYIKLNYVSSAAFARELGISRALLHQWKGKGYEVINGAIYQKALDLPSTENKTKLIVS